jgi:DNA-directed RNA polymerase specialized sigma24 family protein
VVDAEGEGFAQFVEARQRALQRTAWLLTGDWALAEDLVQTALVRSWPRWERIRRRDDPEIYVRRAMVHSWVSWRRRRWWGERATAAVPDREAAGDVAAEVAVRVTRSGSGSPP